MSGCPPRGAKQGGPATDSSGANTFGDAQPPSHAGSCSSEEATEERVSAGKMMFSF